MVRRAAVFGSSSMLAALATLAVSKNRFPTTRGASAPPPPPAGASRAGYPPAEEYARAQKEALARKYSAQNSTSAPPYIDSPSNAWKQIQQNTAWIKELDHGCADGLRELDERMAKLEKTLERMEDWAEQVGKHLGRRLEPG